MLAVIVVGLQLLEMVLMLGKVEVVVLGLALESVTVVSFLLKLLVV